MILKPYNKKIGFSQKQGLLLKKIQKFSYINHGNISVLENGKVIVAECILPVTPEAVAAAKVVVHVDVIMLAHNPGGKERTESEFKALANSAGFTGFRVVCNASNTHIMKFLKIPHTLSSL